MSCDISREKASAGGKVKEASSVNPKGASETSQEC